MDTDDGTVIEATDMVARWRADEIRCSLDRRRRDGIASAILELDQRRSYAHTHAVWGGVLTVVIGILALLTRWDGNRDTGNVFLLLAAVSAAWFTLELAKQYTLLDARIAVLEHLHDAGFRWTFDPDHGRKPSKPHITDKFGVAQTALWEAFGKPTI